MEKIVSKQCRNIREEKKRVRKTVLSLRNGMTPVILEEYSVRIMRSLFKTDAYQNADVILTYVNYQSEVITTSLIARAIADDKAVFAPRVEGAEMEFYRISGMENLTEGYRGILEPAGDALFKGNDNYVLMVMPGVVFDKECHRIGYGKGFYDRYINRITASGVRLHTLALCYECQLLMEIPYEVHDRKPDIIITEKRVIEAKENFHE